MIPWLERRFGKFGIENLTIYLVILIAGISGAGILFRIPHIPLTPELLFTSQWWHVAIYPFRIDTSFLVFFITLYMLGIFGPSLQSDMGDFRYTLFIFIGILSSTAAAVFLPYPPPSDLYIYICVLLAMAYRVPNMEILLFFILPVKLKYLAWIVFGVLLLSSANTARVVGNGWPFLSLGLSLLNLILFFGPEIIAGARRRQQGSVARARFRGAVTIHCCHICGKTEHDDPQMDFRFCAECADHEYCRDHLHDHTHVN